MNVEDLIEALTGLDPDLDVTVAVSGEGIREIEGLALDASGVRLEVLG